MLSRPQDSLRQPSERALARIAVEQQAGKTMVLYLGSLIQLAAIIGCIEVTPRGGDESIRSNRPRLEATDLNSIPRASRPGVGAD